MNLIELVPKNLNTLLTQAKECLAFAQIKGINLPDLIDIDLPIEQAATHLLKNQINTIPHFRAIDKSTDDHLKTMSQMIDLGLKQLLIISGDNKIEQAPKASTLETVQALKETFPALKVYCGLDQWRTSLHEELDYCKKKLAAGADGFFTQPFYEASLAQVYFQELPNTEIYLGISPVLSEQNKNWWEKRNKVVFPPNFDLSYEYHCNLAQELIQLANNANQHTYLMPITTNPIEYLTGVFKT